MLNSDIAPKKEWCIGLTQNGERIYQCIIDNIGINLNTTSTITEYTFNHGIENVNEILSYDFTINKDKVSYELPYMDGNGVDTTSIRSVNKSSIKLQNKQALSGFNLVGLITYTKVE